MRRGRQTSEPMNSPMATTAMLTPIPVQLPEEIMTEILKRVPVRTLVELKCVCKLWNKLITDPIFINTHLHFNSPTRIILANYIDSFLSLPLSIPLNPNPNPNSRRNHRLPRINGDTYHIKGHCNGLLCLIGEPIILYNPFLSRYRTLPTPSNFNGKGEVLGIGYDSSVNDYKIVRVPSIYRKYKCKGYKPQIEVLSLNSNSWRKLPEIETPPYFMAHDTQSLYLNGGIYWLTVGEDGPTLIVRFDVSKERFSNVPPPQGHRISWIGVINHSFCAVFSHSESYFDIWETQDNLNWKKFITVSKFGNPRPYGGYLDHYPLCFIQTGELLIIYPDIGLMAYDPKEHRYRRFALLRDARGSQVTVYTDSVVFPPEPLDQIGSSFDQAGSSLGQTGSSSSAFTKMFMQLSDAFRSRFSCLSNSAKGCK